MRFGGVGGSTEVLRKLGCWGRSGASAHERSRCHLACASAGRAAECMQMPPILTTVQLQQLPDLSLVVALTRQLSCHATIPLWISLQGVWPCAGSPQVARATPPGATMAGRAVHQQHQLPTPVPCRVPLGRLLTKGCL